MARTRSSKQSSPATKAGRSSKRAAEPTSTPAAKRGKPSKKTDKKQILISENDTAKEDDKDNQVLIGDDKVGEKGDNTNGEDESKTSGDMEKSGENAEMKWEKEGEKEDDKKEAEKKEDPNKLKDGDKNAFDEIEAAAGDAGDPKEAREAVQKDDAQEKKDEEITTNNNSIIEDKEREAEMPSSILEKGVIYFFFRPRVNVEDPQGIEDVARSYIVLRPLPKDAKLGEGPLEDLGNNRLLVLPKKTLPKSRQDRFLVFVEKAKAKIQDLREQFAGNEYATKTSGTSTTEPTRPMAEGIYAITSTGRESHLAYQITVPDTLGDVQKDLGLNEKGSYVVSVKNPKKEAPANASLPNPAEYPEEIHKKFRDLGWMPLEPELLEYENTQFLVIGEGLGDLGKAVEEQSKDHRDDSKEKPEEELERLEEEDHQRVEHLKEDDPVLADLGLSAKDYPKMQTTW